MVGSLFGEALSATEHFTRPLQEIFPTDRNSANGSGKYSLGEIMFNVVGHVPANQNKNYVRSTYSLHTLVIAQIGNLI